MKEFKPTKQQLFQAQEDLDDGKPISADLCLALNRLNVDQAQAELQRQIDNLVRPQNSGVEVPAFMKPLTPSAALATVVGTQALARVEVVKRLWTYIKKHKLQDRINKRMINADDKLMGVFGKSQVTMFEMAGLIGKHLR